MPLRSHIDWNELFPHFPKALRETLMLEAVTILSKPRANAPITPLKRPRVDGGAPFVARRNFRHWKRDGGGGRLTASTRKYRVMDLSISPGSKRPNSKMARLWGKLSADKVSTLTKPEMVTYCKAVGANPDTTISNLWSIGALEVIT